MLGSNGSMHLDHDVLDMKESDGVLPAQAYHHQSTEGSKSFIANHSSCALLNWIGSKAIRGSADFNHPIPRPWSSTILRLGPITGILGMFLAMASLVASLGILVGSHGADTSSWIGEPSIYLAGFTAIASLSMRYACIQGVAITWWIRATRGSTVSELHWNWKAGTGIFGAIASGRKMGAIGLACVFSTLVVIDGPVSTVGLGFNEIQFSCSIRCLDQYSAQHNLLKS